MARPRAKELTDRELEVMQIFWSGGELTAQDVRDRMSDNGRELAYTTVATLVKILSEKGFLIQTTDQRPFSFRPARTYEDVSGSMLGDILERVFGGSREMLLTRLLERKKLSAAERRLLKQILDES